MKNLRKRLACLLLSALLLIGCLPVTALAALTVILPSTRSPACSTQKV